MIFCSLDFFIRQFSFIILNDILQASIKRQDMAETSQKEASAQAANNKENESAGCCFLDLFIKDLYVKVETENNKCMMLFI